MGNKGKGITLYYTIEQYVKNKIETGEWPMGTKLPTEAEFAEMFSVSRTTVRMALDSMVDSGIIIRKQGSGTYVMQPPHGRNRLQSQPSIAVCNYIYEPVLRNEFRHIYQNLISDSLAHILVLNRGKLISEQNARKLASFLVTIKETRPSDMPANPLSEDIFLNFEEYLISKVGIEAGGELHIGRSRNDMNPAICRMSIRDSMLVQYERIETLIFSLLTIAENNTDHIMTGYTHMQPAVPITIAHYFSGIAEALTRDYERMLDAYKRLNICPSGSVTMSGSYGEIDRRLEARLRGFDDIIVNTLDGVASRDYLLELASCFSTMGSTITRFMQDLYFWNTNECGYLSFSDSLCSCSITMPHKKNPLSVEHIRSKCSFLTSAYINLIMILRSSNYTYTRDLEECMQAFWDMLEETNMILSLCLDLIDGIEFNYVRMEKFASENKSNITALVDYMAKHESISYRSAHNIVSEYIKAASHEYIDTHDFYKTVSESFARLTGRRLHISYANMCHIIDVHEAITTKANEGGVSSASCRSMLCSLNTRLQNDANIRKQYVDRQKKAAEELQTEISSLLD